MRALVGIGVHQVSAALGAVAPGAADFLIVAFKTRRQTGVNDTSDVGFVDPHAKGDGGDNGLQFAALECPLHAVARFCVEARMVGSGW